MPRGGSHPCETGCTCARHPGGRRPTAVCPVCGTVFEFPRADIGRRKFCSPECNLIDYNESAERWTSKSESVKRGYARKPPEERILHGKRISETRKSLGIRHSDETKALLADCAVYNYQGGKTGDAFARVLCPAGFVREHRVYYGDPLIKVGIGGLGRLCRSFNLDFAYVGCKIAVELDGPGHKASFEEDATRDAILRELGWHVIRIKHA